MTRAVVAPFTGAWIEMGRVPRSAPWSSVAPFTGAWIEMDVQVRPKVEITSRSLHGSVD